MKYRVEVTNEETDEVTLLSLKEFEVAFNDNLLEEHETIKFISE